MKPQPVMAVLVVVAVLAWSAVCWAEAPHRQAMLPLKVSENGRYLVDQKDQPFLVVGDTPWSLIVQPQEEDIDRYLEDRQKRGFNSITVNLIEHKFCTTPPKTRSGLSPFDTPGDFSTPNQHYFDLAYRVVQKASEYGIVVWLAPAYLGYGGGDEGFFREMKAGGQEKLRAYGRFVGRRFRDLPNIIWLLGGDYTPKEPDRWTVTALAEAIREEDPQHLMTVHAAPETPAAGVFGAERWLTVNTVYSYEPALFRPVLAEYRRKPARPFVLIESTYEGEHNSTPEQIRRQAYWAMLGGACGQFLGNNPLWHFDGPGLFAAKMTWQQALDAVGSRDTARVGALFSQLPWHHLRPEENHAVVTAGYGEGLAAAMTARTLDGKLSVTYVPSTGVGTRVLTVAAGQFAGHFVARWFNPTNGGFTQAEGVPPTNGGLYRVSTPGDNGTQSNDWVLIIAGSE
jgi:hypothetical protein